MTRNNLDVILNPAGQRLPPEVLARLNSTDHVEQETGPSLDEKTRQRFGLQAGDPCPDPAPGNQPTPLPNGPRDDT
jgi:hypothetical protein